MVTVSTPTPPMNFNPSPGQLLAAAEERKRAANEVVEKIVAEVHAEDGTWENSILPLIQSENLRNRNDPPIGFLEEVSPSKALRDASRQAQVLLSDSMQEVSVREEIYEIISALLQNESEQLNQASKYYLRKQSRSFIENGFSIRKGPQRDRYQQIRKRITAIRADINKMGNENKEGLWLTREEMDGVPENVIKTLPVGNPEGENSGKLWLQFWCSACTSVKSSASSSSIRRLVTVKESYRCSEIAEPMRELLILRDEAARLLGYSSYAASQFEAYLIAAPARLENFFSAFKSQTLSMVQKTHEELLKVKETYLVEHPQDAWDSPDKLFLWDFSFYRQILQRKSGRGDLQNVREYFPFETTFPQVLNLLEKLFCIRFERIKTGKDEKHPSLPNGAESLTWHEDVMMFRLWDTKTNVGTFLGYIYYDVYKRGGKTNKTICYSLQKSFQEQDGKRGYPTSVVVLNFDKPTKSKPCLLASFDILSLFHETGHALHNVLSQTQFSKLSGTGVCRDFVEVPSTVIERFMLIPGFLYEISCHYSHLSLEYAEAWQSETATGPEKAEPLPLPEKQIPESVILSDLQKLQEAKKFWRISTLAIAQFELTVYNPDTHEDIVNMNLAETYNRIQRDTTLLHGPDELGEGLDWGNMYAQLRSLAQVNSCAAYSYLTCRVYALAIFEAMNIDDPVKLREQCMKFRSTILEPGGSKPELEMLEDFFGHEVILEKLLEELGAENI